MARQQEKEKPVEVTFPVGRLINHSLFQKDQFDDKSIPSYKCEVAYNPDDLNAVMDQVADLAQAKFNFDGGVLFDLDKTTETDYLVTPFLKGDLLARKREKDGKPGDAYKGKIVIRFNTKFNWQGQDAPGGVYVCDEDAKQILPAGQSAIYQGCMVQVIGTLSWYDDDDSGNPACKFYLGGVQKTGDGEKLVSAKDYSTLFKPVGRATSGGEAASGGGRRKRAG